MARSAGIALAASLCAASSLLISACGGSAPPPTEPAPALAAAPAPAPVPAPVPAPAPAPAPIKAAPTDDAAGPAAAAASPDPNLSRQITYVVSPEGLKVTVAGVKFMVNASVTQSTAGWGVKLSVVASATDGKAHSLSNPKAGPLAFAGSVHRKGAAEPEAFGDERSGDGELGVFGDDAKFSRAWPMKGVHALGAGDSLDLQVALWGLGAEKDERRPVKQFCHVRVQFEKGKPRAAVEPPPSAGAK